MARIGKSWISESRWPSVQCVRHSLDENCNFSEMTILHKNFNGY